MGFLQNYDIAPSRCKQSGLFSVPCIKHCPGKPVRDPWESEKEFF